MCGYICVSSRLWWRHSDSNFPWFFYCWIPTYASPEGFFVAWQLPLHNIDKNFISWPMTFSTKSSSTNTIYSPNTQLINCNRQSGKLGFSNNSMYAITAFRRRSSVPSSVSSSIPTTMSLYPFIRSNKKTHRRIKLWQYIYIKHMLQASFSYFILSYHKSLQTSFQINLSFWKFWQKKWSTPKDVSSILDYVLNKLFYWNWLHSFCSSVPKLENI